MGGAATSLRLGASLAPRRTLSCTPQGPRGHGPRRRPRRASFLRPSAPGPAVAARGALGARGPRCPGPEAPCLGGEAGSAAAGSGSAWVAPLDSPTRLGGCEVPDPQESELRNSSEVLLQEDCSGLGRVREATGSPQIWTPHLQFADYLALGAMGTVRGTRGDTFTLHPMIRLNLPQARLLASWTLSKHLCGGERRLGICLL